jgi:hypothetical protein
MTTVDAALEQIREIVSSPRRSSVLLQDRQRWAQLCSAMDAIGDTQLALGWYLESASSAERSDGRSYLIVYGVLQALYLQQDAARQLAACLSLPFQLPAELKEIREARNTAIGHPAGRHDGSSAMISRMTLTPSGFEMLVHTGENRPEFRGVSVRKAVIDQAAVMAGLLEQSLMSLKEEERDHRRQFRDQPLGLTLPHTMLYMAEKIAEGLRDTSLVPFALAAIESIRKSVSMFRQAIHQRGLTELDPIPWTV